ncbi:hypothetical protein JTB14_012298 [Gonioctena quinquepunctata]|nr:hypothetical protein JTB14_012298 [Gonioctena quinquepunctata]
MGSKSVNFSCCKTKPCPLYVCTNCQAIYHKSCLFTKYKSKVKFLHDNKIICCGNETVQSDTLQDEISILEETINELSTDGNLKDNYIGKLKKEKEYIMEEAMRTESEMSDMLNEQKKIIKEMETEIKALESQKITNCIGTQTVNNVKQKSCQPLMMTCYLMK